MQVLRICFAATLLLTLLACGRDQQPTNILHITADDLGYGEVGSFGQQLIKTPHLDQLAAEGMRFTQHYAGSALCNPSRYALMTGKHAGSTGVTTNRPNILPADTFTVARMMQNAGYKTAIIGKWALGRSNTSGAPLNQGFDYFFGYPSQVAAHNYYPETLMENRQRFLLEGNIDSGLINIAKKRITYAGDVIHQQAIAFLTRNRHRPFYLQLDYNLPHINNELNASTGNGFEHPRPSRYAEETWTEPEKSYAEMVSLMDDYIGELIENLRKLGLAENTLVIFTSDNGPTGVRGRKALQRFNSTGGLRGMKGMVFEGGIRVPMIAWWPGGISAGNVSDAITTFWDVMPTLAEITSQPPPLVSDGISFAPILRGRKSSNVDRILYWEINQKKAVRYGNWKWVHHTMKLGSDFLYNIADDPAESVNLAEQFPEVLEKLQSMAASIEIVQ
jgi:arylsulfatase A